MTTLPQTIADKYSPQPSLGYTGQRDTRPLRERDIDEFKRRVRREIIGSQMHETEELLRRLADIHKRYVTLAYELRKLSDLSEPNLDAINSLQARLSEFKQKYSAEVLVMAELAYGVISDAEQIVEDKAAA